MANKKAAVPADPQAYKKIQEEVKARSSRWPNAYASGQVVQKYKEYMKQKGKEPYVGKKPDPKVGLARWYNEKWIDVRTGKACGYAKTDGYYPTCRPDHRVTAKTPTTQGELSGSQQKKMVALKQAAKQHTVAYGFTRKAA